MTLKSVSSGGMLKDVNDNFADAREITCTVGTSILTAGKLTGYLYFVEGIASA